MRKISIFALLAILVTPILIGCSGGSAPADDGKEKPKTSAEDKMMKNAAGDE